MSSFPEGFAEYFADVPDGLHLEDLDQSRIPRHVAVIMDGNGRWATIRGLERGFGHAAGVKALRETITASVRLGIEALTVYAFSTENWNRPTEEVNLLMSLFATTLIDELPLMHRENVRLKILGDIQQLPEETRQTFEHGVTETASHDGMVLAVAVNYGSRAEILAAVRELAHRCETGMLTSADIDEELFSSELDTAPLPDPDLLIRTSGEMRLSNFLLWQLSYTEFCFPDVLWPDFDRWELVRCILDYQSRHRRFGGVEA